MYIEEILIDEYRLCPNLYLGGFSQGGAAALLTGLNISTVPLKGIIALSTFPIMYPVKERMKIPVFIYHGEADEILEANTMRKAYEEYFKGVNLKIHFERGLGHHAVLPPRWQRTGE